MNRLNTNDPLLQNQENQISYSRILFVNPDTPKDFTIHPKPLLVIGGCEQAWIDKNKDLINDKVRSIAYGTYYYGSVGSCDLEQREHKNRFKFKM